MSVPDDDKNYCKYCKSKIHAHQSDLVSQAKTGTEKNVSPFSEHGNPALVLTTLCSMRKSLRMINLHDS